MDPLDGQVQGAAVESGGENFLMPFIEKIASEVHLTEDVGERNGQVAISRKTGNIRPVPCLLLLRNNVLDFFHVNCIHVQILFQIDLDTMAPRHYSQVRVPPEVVFSKSPRTHVIFFTRPPITLDKGITFMVPPFRIDQL